MTQDEKNGWPSFDAILRDVLPAEVEERLRPETSEAARLRREAAAERKDTPVAERPRRPARSRVTEPALTNSEYSSPTARTIDVGLDDLELPAPLPPLEIDTAKVKALLNPSLGDGDDLDDLDISALEKLEEPDIEIFEPPAEPDDVLDHVEEVEEDTVELEEEAELEVVDHVEVEEDTVELEEELEIVDAATQVEENLDTPIEESAEIFDKDQFGADTGIYFEPEPEVQPLEESPTIEETQDGAIGAPLVFDLGSEELVELEANEPIVESAELEDPFADLPDSELFGTSDVPTVDFEAAEESVIEDSFDVFAPPDQEIQNVETFDAFAVPQDDLFDLSESSEEIQEKNRVQSEEVFGAEHFTEDGRTDTNLFGVNTSDRGEVAEENPDEIDLYDPAEPDSAVDSPTNLFSLNDDTDEVEPSSGADVTELFESDSPSKEFNSIATAEAIEGDLNDLDSLDSGLAEVLPLDRSNVELELGSGPGSDPSAPIETGSRRIDYAEFIDEEVETPKWRTLEPDSVPSNKVDRKTDSADPWAHMRPAEEPKKKWWSGVFGGGDKKQRKSEKEAAQEAEIDEAVNLTFDTVCPECGSDGQVDLDDPIGRRVHLSCTACRTEWHTPYDIHS